MVNLIFSQLYQLAAISCWPVLAAYYRVQILIDGKYQESWRYRMGLKLPERLPGHRRIWLHALSVGEVLSAVPLAKAIKHKLPDCELVFSTATETGQKVARERLQQYVAHFYYLPHDFPWVVDAFVQRLNPEVFVLVETDIWPNLLRVLERRRVVRVLANARLSPRSVRRFRTFRRVFAPFEYFEKIFVQSAWDRDNLLLLGTEVDKVQALGNLKFDAVPERVSQGEANRLRESAGIAVQRRAWIAGSTHEGEEEKLLRAHQRLRRAYPDLLLILAPRDIRRAPELIAVAGRLGLSTAARSSGDSAAGKPVYLLDTLGELSRFYALADVAFIGGSLVPFGGHNPLEAMAQGKTCVWGPHLFNFHEIEAQLLEAGSGVKVWSEAQLQEVLAQQLRRTGGKSDAFKGANGSLFSRCGCAEEIAEVLLAICSTRREVGRAAAEN